MALLPFSSTGFVSTATGPTPTSSCRPYRTLHRTYPLQLPERSRWRRGWLPERGVENRPEVDRPAKQEDPQHDGQHELEYGHSQSALNQLSQSGNEEAANRGDDVSCGSLTGH